MKVLPVPVAMATSMARLPLATADSTASMAFFWYGRSLSIRTGFSENHSNPESRPNFSSSPSAV